MPNHQVVSRDKWIDARKSFLAKEREFTHLRDELSRRRRELPWVKVQENYVFDSPQGKRTLADLSADLTTYPQVLVNVRVREKVDLASVPAIAAAISRVESRLEGRGRLLVRYSGTEPLLRVMLEGQQEAEIRGWAQEIVDVVRAQIG